MEIYCMTRALTPRALWWPRGVGRRRWWHPTPVLLPGKSHGRSSMVGCSPWGCEESDMTERLHFHFSLYALEKEMATHSSVLAWRIPVTLEPGGLPSVGSHRVGHDWNDLAAAEEWEGVGGGREVQEQGDIHIPMANSCWCMAETNTIL